MAFTKCGSCVTMNIAEDCNTPRIRGFKNTALLICKDSIASKVVDATTGNITSVTLATGAKTVVVYNPRVIDPFDPTVVSYNEDTFDFNKVVGFEIRGIGGSISKNIIEPLANGEYIMILQRKDERGDGSYPVVGSERGLTLTSVDGSEAEGEGRWLITMTETNAPSAEICLFDTDYATTKTAYDALEAQSY